MLTDFEDWAGDTQAVIPALTAFLWWGIAVRGVLLFALATLWVVEGNFLAEWLLSWNVVPVGPAEVEEYSAIGYAAFIVFLTAGTIARAATLRRLRRPPRRRAPVPPENGQNASGNDDNARPEGEKETAAEAGSDSGSGASEGADAAAESDEAVDAAESEPSAP